MKNKLFILLLAFVLLLSACSNNSPPDDNTKEVLPELESAGSIESRGEKFIENFPQILRKNDILVRYEKSMRKMLKTGTF